VEVVEDFVNKRKGTSISTPAQLAVAWRELEEAGIPLEPRKFRIGVRPNAGLMIRQMPTDYCEAKIRELNDGRVAYVMPVFIRRDEPGKTIVRGCTLGVPWDESIEWLEEDEKRNRGWYTFSRDYPPKREFARATVLNHRMICTLSRGDIREGLLLAVGKVRPPEQYRDGQVIPIRFSILDQWDCEPYLMFQLPLERSRHRVDEKPRPRRNRVPLLSQPDYTTSFEKVGSPDAAMSDEQEAQAHNQKVLLK